MPIMRRYQCPDCEGIFQFLHLTREEPPPSHCDICGSWMGEEPEPELSLPAVGGSVLSRSVDQIAAESERQGIALQDGLKAGDPARRLENNVVANFAASAGHQYFGASAAEILPMTKMGQERGTGAGVLGSIQKKRMGL